MPEMKAMEFADKLNLQPVTRPVPQPKAGEILIQIYATGDSYREALEAEREITKEIIPMKLTGHGHSAFRIEAGGAEILIDLFLSDNPSWDKGWSGYLAGKNS